MTTLLTRLDFLNSYRFSYNDKGGDATFSLSRKEEVNWYLKKLKMYVTVD